MNKLDIISQIWNYFQGCAKSVPWAVLSVSYRLSLWRG